MMVDFQAKSSHSNNPIDALARDHVIHTRLCDWLEEIADGLPNQINQDLCAKVSAALKSELRLHHDDEEKGLFPLLRKQAATEPGLFEIINHLTHEHEADESFAVDLIEDLDGMAAGEYPKNPDMFGYMLRGFFEGYRRHIAWENTVLLPLARRCLGPGDLKQLSTCMKQNRVATQVQLCKNAG